MSDLDDKQPEMAEMLNKQDDKIQQECEGVDGLNEQGIRKT